MNDRFNQLLDGYYAGSLSAEEVAELEALLLADPGLRDRFRRAAALDTAMRQAALREADAVEAPSTPHAPASPTTRRSWFALAACLLCVLVAAFALSSLLREPEVARLVQVTGDVEVRNTSGSRKAKEGARIRNGSELACASGNTEVVFRLVDGSTFSAKSGSRVRLLRAEGQFRLEVLDGVIDGEIKKQPDGKPLLIATADSTIKVLGTKLTVRYSADSTRLIVEEGQVEMTRTRDQEKVLVQTDETAMVASSGDLAVMNISELTVGPVEIVRARYGASEHWVDVTQALRSRVTDSTLISVGDFNHLAGDPIYQVVKTLEVEYTIDGEPGKQRYDEYVHTARRVKNTEIILSGPALSNFNSAQWIWHVDAGKAAGTWYFRKALELPIGDVAARGQILLTCDNAWILHINGQPAAQSIQAEMGEDGRNVWQLPELMDVTSLLVPGRNVISIAGTNFDHQYPTKAGRPSPAGLLVKLVVDLEGKEAPLEWVSDASWISAATPEAGWQDPDVELGIGWHPVTVLGGHGIPPWGVLDPRIR